MNGPVAPATVRGALLAGQPVVLLDGDGGGLLLAAATVTPQSVAFAVRHGSGLLRVVIPDAEADRLGLPLMWHGNARGPAAGFAVSVDAATGVTTGISATDRAHTIRLLADPATTSADLRRPGHVIPVRAGSHPAGYAAATLDVLRSAQLHPAAVFTDVVHGARGELASRGQLREFAARHGLPVTTAHPARWARSHTSGNPIYALADDVDACA